MSISDIILVLIALIMPFLWFLLLQRLPEKQRAALDQFAKYAVYKVEQQYSHFSNSQKKAYAETVIENCFRAARLPIPDYVLIDASIEYFVYVMKQFQVPPQEPPEPEPATLKTGPLPVPQGA